MRRKRAREPEARRPAPRTDIPDLDKTLNEDQAKAREEILISIEDRVFHVVDGAAGTGKTVLLQALAVDALRKGLKVVGAAPTHAAVGVLAGKLEALGIDLPCSTLQSLLGLKAKINGDRMTFERSAHAEPIEADAILLDEASMVGVDLNQFCQRWLKNRAVIFSGDAAQLNPVGEGISPVFGLKRHSHLEAPQRQAIGNPILQAAWSVRTMQETGVASWDWCKPAFGDNQGIYAPGRNLDVWMRKAFTSDAFQADTNTHRFLCWTNKRVADVNRQVRHWIYGQVDTPFVVGEKALIRDPLVRDDSVVLQTGQEVTVLAIEGGEHRRRFQSRGGVSGWEAVIPTWNLQVRDAAGMTMDVMMPRDESALKQALNCLADEARETWERWKDFHSLKQAFLSAQAIYARTIHTAQGSTVKNCFLDVPEIRRWVSRDPVEALRGLYVGMTRPSHTLTLAGG